MSPFLVYLMMQADSIRTTFGVISIIFGILSVIGLVAYVSSSSFAEDDEGARMFLNGITKPCKYVWLVFSFSIFMNAFFPSTRTIAVMVVLPKVTSPQALDAMGSEAKDIYLLAKDALKSLSQSKKKDGK